MDMDKLMLIIEKKIVDKRFINLIVKVFKAGYFDSKIYHGNNEESPDCSIISPILINIYMNVFDISVGYIEKNYHKERHYYSKAANRLNVNYEKNCRL
jgi:retron-type reverse transcriptase